MPKKWDRCVKEVKLKIKKGEMPKTYIGPKTRQRLKSNPYKVCSFLLEDKTSITFAKDSSLSP